MTEVVDTPAPTDRIEDDVPRIRALVIAFYKRCQPNALEEGLDVSGLVEWIGENGLRRFNEVLKSNFNGRHIDPEEDLGSTQRQFQRASMAITPNLFQNTQKNKLRIKRKLKKFYAKHDERKLDPSNDFQFQRVVNVGVLHGIPTLNKLLKRKYKDVISEEDTESELAEEEEVVPAGGVTAAAVNLEDIDETRLQADLTVYFDKVNASDQIELLDSHIDWVCRMGFTEWNVRSKQLYGRAFDDVLIGMDRDPWQEDYANNKNDIVLDPTELDNNRPVSNREWRPGMPFEELTDEELEEELVAFYKYFDPDNLENMEQLIKGARDLGRTKLNIHLTELYHCALRDNKDYGGKLVKPSTSMATIDSGHLGEILRAAEDKEDIDTLNKAESEANEATEEHSVDEKTEDNKSVAEESVKSSKNSVENKPEEGNGYSTDEELGEDDVNHPKNFMVEKIKTETKKGGLMNTISKRLFGEKVTSVFSSIRTSNRKQVIGKMKTIEDPVTEAQLKAERTRRGGSMVTKLDGRKSERNVFIERKAAPKKTDKPVKHRTRGSVARLVQRTEKRMKKKPNKYILDKIKAAENGQDSTNPVLMFSSRNIRQKWNADELEAQL